MSSTPFERHLLDIDGFIKISPEERGPYLIIFEYIQNLLIQEMRQADRVFDKLCIGPSTVGRGRDIAGNLETNEFELLCVLEFPFEMEIGLDDDRPGYVHLDLYNVLKKLKDSDDDFEDVYNKLNDMVDVNNAYLKRNTFQSWISTVIRKALKLVCTNTDYTMTYDAKPNQEVAHCLNVWEKSNPQNKIISIDFVPVISMGQVYWMRGHKVSIIKDNYYHSFYAVPVDTKRKWHKTTLYTFLMINPLAENELLWSKDNIKIVFRLLKSMCDSYEIHEMHNYFLINALLWLLISEAPNFFENEINEIFLRMLNMLCDYFGVGDMPNFWVHDCNLLDILRDDDTDDYFESLLRATETLNTYPHQRNLSLGRTITHFALPGDDAWDYDDSSSSSEYESICYRNDNKYWSQKQYHVQYKCVQNYEVAGYRSENQYSITNHFLGQYQYPNGCQYNSNNNTYKYQIWK